MTDAQLDRLDAWCAEKMGWKPPEHPDTKAMRKKRGLTNSHYDHEWLDPDGSLWSVQAPQFPHPTRDANAAAELRKAGISRSSRAVVLRTWPDGRANCYSRDGKRDVEAGGDTENIATALWFVKLNGGDPDEVMGDA